MNLNQDSTQKIGRVESIGKEPGVPRAFLFIEKSRPWCGILQNKRLNVDRLQDRRIIKRINV